MHTKKIIKCTFSKLLNKVTVYKDKHKGDSCYIIGDGSSIKYFKLNTLSNFISFACNYIPFHNDFEKLNAKYCIMSAPFYFSPFFGYDDPIQKRHLYIMSKHYKKVVKKYPEKQFFFNLSNYPFINTSNTNFNFLNYPSIENDEMFISNRINCFAGVIRHSISLAIYMGFKNIYLVGCDYTHSPAVAKHWYEKGVGKIFELENYETEFFKIASEFANITTVTVNGKSDRLNYIKYQELTGDLPIFRENKEIINDLYLNDFKSWHDYTI
jgi:hypothetical protein